MLNEAVLCRLRTHQLEAQRNRQEAKVRKTRILRQAVRRLMTTSRTPLTTKSNTKSKDPGIEFLARIDNTPKTQLKESKAISKELNKQVISSNTSSSIRNTPNLNDTTNIQVTSTSNEKLLASPIGSISASSLPHSKKRSLTHVEISKTPKKPIDTKSSSRNLCPESPTICNCSVQNRTYVKKLKWKRLQLLMQKLPLDRLIACYLCHMFQSTGWKNLKKKAQACGLEISKSLTAINPKQNTSFDLRVYPLQKDHPKEMKDWLEERYFPIQNGSTGSTFHELLIPGYLTTPTCGSLKMMKQLQQKIDHEFLLYQKKLVFYQSTIQKEIQMINTLLPLELNLNDTNLSTTGTNTILSGYIMINEYGLYIDPRQQGHSIADEEKQRSFLFYFASF
jgi:hypothetical protein